MISEEEWLQRCAKIFEDQLFMEPGEALTHARICFDANEGDESYTPEDCADEEIWCMGQDGEIEE